MLEVKNLSVTYNGNIKALKNVNLNVNKGELVVLIGTNGAGKTTLLKTLTGLVKSDSGSFANLDLTGLKDKRTLNRFCGQKITDKLLEAFGTSEAVFEFLQSAEIDDKIKIKGISFEKLKRLKNRYQKYEIFANDNIPSAVNNFYNETPNSNLNIEIANNEIIINFECVDYFDYYLYKVEDNQEVLLEKFCGINDTPKIVDSDIDNNKNYKYYLLIKSPYSNTEYKTNYISAIIKKDYNNVLNNINNTDLRGWLFG